MRNVRMYGAPTPSDEFCGGPQVNWFYDTSVFVTLPVFVGGFVIASFGVFAASQVRSTTAPRGGTAMKIAMMTAAVPSAKMSGPDAAASPPLVMKVSAIDMP
jgi:hypothetical protein